MSKSILSGLSCLLASFVAVASPAPASGSAPAAPTPVIRAEERGHPWMHVLDAHELPVVYRADTGRFERSALSPAGLAAADLDGDGAADLLAAYDGPDGAWLALHRFDPEARGPGRFVHTPFRSETRVVPLPAPPRSFVAADLDGDGRDEVVVADGEGAGLWWLRGSETFGHPRYVPLPGVVTALVAGDDDPADGRREVFAAVRGPEASRVVVLGLDGGETLRVEASRLTTAAPVSSLAIGRFDDDARPDLAVASGPRLTLLSDDVPLGSRSFAAGIRAMAFGRFVDDREPTVGIVVSLEDGTLRFLIDDPSADRDRVVERARVSAPGLDDLVAADASSRPGDDILVNDTAGRRLWVRTGGPSAGTWTSFEAIAPVTAAQPMRLNDDVFVDWVVQLEGSTAPAVLMSAPSAIFTVDSTGDEPDAAATDGLCATEVGTCTLRAAIEQANAAAGTDAVGFDIPGVPPHAIRPASPLPAVTDPLILDATTEPDWTGTPVVELDGSASGSGDGLVVLAGSSSIEGLVVNRFAGSGVSFSGVGAVENRLQRSYVGTDVAGSAAAANLENGVRIHEGARLNVVGTDGDGVADDGEGNVISGNGSDGVLIVDADTDGNVVAGNRIGTDASGTEAIANGSVGVVVINFPAQNRIGTNGDGVSDADERNVVSGNGVRGVLLAGESEGSVVAGNFIGTDVSGSAALPNAGGGVEISNGARSNRVGTNADGLADTLERNVVSGNGEHGISMFGTPAVSGNTIAGNFIGVAADGTTALGNAAHGISMSDADDTRIGLAAPDGGNVISGNGGDGIAIGSTSSATRIQGNRIGTDTTGTTALGNTGNGIYIDGSSSNVVGTDGDGVDDDLEGNVVSGNGNVGVLIAFGATDNVIAGNRIGTDEAGGAALPNAGYGVELSNGVRRTRVGTNVDGVSDESERNVISGNGSSGVTLFGSPSTDDNVVAGNFIGTQADGTSPLGNQSHGILINTDASDNTIGGTGTTPGSCDGPCNVIAHNGIGASLDGVRIAAGTHNTVIGNRIHSNHAGSGIDIARAATTANDPGDTDGGANNAQNFPILTEATSSGGTTTVLGRLESLGSTDFRIELYANTACDVAGYGEGETFVAVRTVTTGADGTVDFSIPVSPEIDDGTWLSATATRIDVGAGPTDTSEFSPCLAVGAVTSAGTVPDGDVVPGIQLTVDKGAVPAESVLSWGASCVAADVDYAVFIGTLGDFTSHWARRCSTEGQTTTAFRTQEPSLYFLVVPMSGNREGSYGVDSDHVERPPGYSVCHAQLIGACD